MHIITITEDYQRQPQQQKSLNHHCYNNYYYLGLWLNLKEKY